MRERRLLAVAAVDRPGGAEIGLARLLRRLAARGWDITLATPAGAGIPGASAARTVALPLGGLAPGTGARALRSWPRARRLARSAHVAYLNGTVAGRLLPAARGARTVLHVHDIVERVPRFWRAADVVLAPSRAVAERLDGLEAEVVYMPVELEPAPVPAPWPAGDGPIVGFVGRLEPRRGPLELVRAAPAIRAGAPGARVVVVGDDPYESDPAYARAVRASPDVEHYGWVEGADGLMRHLDVLVAPSVQEPGGTVLLEAMAAGTPVVATRVGGLPEVVRDGETGLLVEPGSPEALASAVLRVLAERERMGAAAAEHARRFSADAYADRVEALIA